MDIVNRLEAHNSFCEDRDSAQLRKDAAEEIRQLRREVQRLESTVNVLGRNQTRNDRR